jgi:chromosomal replication initiation ATPase DnaA
VEELKVQADEEPETPRPKRPLSAVFRSIAQAVEVDPSVLSGSDRGWAVSRLRALVGYVLIRRMGYKLNEVAKCLGRDTATVSSLISRYSDRMTMDQELKKRVSRMVKDCLEHKV